MDAAIRETQARRMSPLVAGIVDRLRAEIAEGRYGPGARLPSEAELTRAHGVSRTVVREAIGVLRSEGRVESRKGSGVFVLEAGAPEVLPFADLDASRISGAIELLELRSAFEIRSATLAASRRSAEQLDAILAAHARLAELAAVGLSTREADFDFHYAIACATQNRRFPEFLAMIRPGIVPRAVLGAASPDPAARAPNPDLVAEHVAVLNAIVDGDAEAAAAAMTTHLESSLRRYRGLLRSPPPAQG